MRVVVACVARVVVVTVIIGLVGLSAAILDSVKGVSSAACCALAWVLASIRSRCATKISAKVPTRQQCKGTPTTRKIDMKLKA